MWRKSYTRRTKAKIPARSNEWFPFCFSALVNISVIVVVVIRKPKFRLDFIRRNLFLVVVPVATGQTFVLFSGAKDLIGLGIELAVVRRVLDVNGAAFELNFLP